MMKPKTELAAQVIKRAFKSSGAFSDEDIDEVVFHLTDWIDDLKLLVDLLENPEGHQEDEVRRVIIGFLVHAPDHLSIAASKVLESGSAEAPKSSPG